MVSRFYGNERVSDARLRDYLLMLTPALTTPQESLPALTVSTELPGWFTRMLATDARRSCDLWEGRGKHTGTDRSHSGYDFSITCYLLSQAKSKPDDLATLLAARQQTLGRP